MKLDEKQLNDVAESLFLSQSTPGVVWLLSLLKSMPAEIAQEHLAQVSRRQQSSDAHEPARSVEWYSGRYYQANALHALIEGMIERGQEREAEITEDARRRSDARERPQPPADELDPEDDTELLQLSGLTAGGGTSLG